MLVLLLVLPGCGEGDAEAELLELPRVVAELVRAGELDEAGEHLADDFEAGGMNRQQVLFVIPRQIDLATNKPYVVEVVAHEPERDAPTRKVTVVGLWVRGDLLASPPSRFDAFRVELDVRREGSSWKVVRARYDR